MIVWAEAPLSHTDPEVGEVTRIAAVRVRSESRAKIIMSVRVCVYVRVAYRGRSLGYDE